MSEGPDRADGSARPPAWQPPVDPGWNAGAAQSSQTPAPGQQNPGWTPPTQVGLVPLRPMTLGTLLSGSFRALRRNPRPLLGIALSSQLLVGLLTAVVLVLALVFTFARLENVSAENADEVTAGSILALVLANLVPALVSIAVVALLQGIVVVEVSRAVLGEKLTLRQLWGRARGRFWALIGWTLLIFVAVIVALAVIAGVVALLVWQFGTVGIVVGVLLAIASGLGLLAVAIWLGTKLSLVPSALMVERMPLRAAIRRSWRLTDRHFWRTFGVQALVAVILNVAVQVIVTPISFIIPMISLVIDPNGGESALAVGIIAGAYLVFLTLVVALSAVMMVVQSATNGLIYIDLRMRKEGLELDLARFVEQRDSGVTTLSDPYLPATPAASTSTSWRDQGVSESPWQ